MCKGEIEIRIIGREGNEDLTPRNFDIRDIKLMIESVEPLLYPNPKNRPIISYEIANGSVKHIFRTSKEAVVKFSAIATLVANMNSIDGLEAKTAKVFEFIQEQARSKDYVFEIKTSENDNILRIDTNTNFRRTEDLWLDTELYFYGEIVNAGGKADSNVHLDTKENGTIIISTDRNYLIDQKENLLYKKYGARVIGKQNIVTREINKQSLKLVSLIGYSPKYDDEYISSLIAKAAPKFVNFDADEWLSGLRGINA